MIIYFFYIIYFLIRFLKKLIVLLVTYLWLVSFGWPEKTIATCSSTLAWKIPWAEEPGRLQSMGSLRVGHNWATSLSLSCIGEGNGNPLQCSCLENPRDGGAWWAAVYEVAQSRTRLKRLSSSSHVLLCVFVCVYIYTTFSLSIPLLMDTGCFHVLVTINSVAMNIGVHVSFQIRVFVFSGYMPRSRIVGSHGDSVFSLLGKASLWPRLRSPIPLLLPYSVGQDSHQGPPSFTRKGQRLQLLRGWEDPSTACSARAMVDPSAENSICHRFA